MSIPKLLSNFETSLVAKISDTASSLTIATSVNDDGTTLAGTYLLTVDEGTSVEEHMIVTLAGAAGTIGTRGVSKVDAVTSKSANKFAHERGAEVKITDIALIRVVNRLNGDEAFDSVAWTGVASVAGLSTPTAGETTKAANVDYVNNVAIAGASDATETTKGIVEFATYAEALAGTDTGTTGAGLVVKPSYLAKLIQNSGFQYAADAGTTDTYVITVSPAPTAYAAGQGFIFKANTVNTGAATLNVNSLGAITIKKNHDQDLEDGDVEAGKYVTVIYDGTNFEMINQQDTMPSSAVLSEMSTFFGLTDITGTEAETLSSGATSDASALHKHAPKNPFISVYSGYAPVTGDGADREQIISDSTGDNIYAVWNQGTSPNLTITIFRFAKDSITGNYYYVNAVSLTESGSDIGTQADNVGAWSGSTYVWIAARAKTTNYTTIWRFNKDLTGKQIMTMSANIGENVSCACGTDTVGYISSQADDHWLTYTISGTTATQGTDITDASGVNAVNRAGAFFDGTNLYYMDSATSDCPIKKITTGGTVVSTTTKPNLVTYGTTLVPIAPPLGRGITFRDTESIYLVGNFQPDAATNKFILSGTAITKP